MIITFPRFPPAAAAERLVELTPLPAAELQQHSDFQHNQAYWYPTGGRVAKADLRELADAVRGCAAEHGWPSPLGSRSFTTTAFDRQLSRLLVDNMQIIPADAASDDVWSFLSLVLLPDVAFWRFPNTTGRADYERLLGRPRNVFRRLWWRAYTLGAEASEALFEDEAVAVMERPTLAGDRRLARAIVDRHLAMAQADPKLPRTELLRQVTKRVRRLCAVLTVPALSDAQLRAIVEEVADASLFALTESSTRLPAGAIGSRQEQVSQAGPKSRDWVPVRKQYKGNTVRAEFHLSTLEVRVISAPWSGRVFPSPTAAARAVVEHFGGALRTTSTNGRKFWFTEGGEDLRSLIGQRP